MILIHDVETLNGVSNFSSSLEKQPFQEQVNKLGTRLQTHISKEDMITA